MPTSPKTARLARVTKRLPGPVILSTRAMALGAVAEGADGLRAADGVDLGHPQVVGAGEDQRVDRAVRPGRRDQGDLARPRRSGRESRSSARCWDRRRGLRACSSRPAAAAGAGGAPAPCPGWRSSRWGSWMARMRAAAAVIASRMPGSVSSQAGPSPRRGRGSRRHRRGRAAASSAAPRGRPRGRPPRGWCRTTRSAVTGSSNHAPSGPGRLGVEDRRRARAARRVPAPATPRGSGIGAARSRRAPLPGGGADPGPTATPVTVRRSAAASWLTASLRVLREAWLEISRAVERPASATSTRWLAASVRPRGGDVDDAVGETHGRGQLHRPVELDQLHREPQRVEETAGGRPGTWWRRGATGGSCPG